MTPELPGRTALVLGGGGITGIAWELGLLTGLADAGLDLTDADLVVGTSAGSVVGAQVTSSTPLRELYDRQLEPPSTEQAARAGPWVLAGLAVAMLRARGDVEAFGRSVGAFALKRTRAGRTPTLAARPEVISSRLPVHTWPARDLRVTAVDAMTGGFTVLDPSSGVDLVTAVAASCAVPGVYPPVDIAGRPHIDGGVRSGANVDIAAGLESVVVLAPLPRGFGPIASPGRQAERLGVDAIVVSPDQTAVAAIGKNVLDPAARSASARAGYAQTSTVLPDVRQAWDRAHD